MAKANLQNPVYDGQIRNMSITIDGLSTAQWPYNWDATHGNWFDTRTKVPVTITDIMKQMFGSDTSQWPAIHGKTADGSSTTYDWTVQAWYLDTDPNADTSSGGGFNFFGPSTGGGTKMASGSSMDVGSMMQTMLGFQMQMQMMQMMTGMMQNIGGGVSSGGGSGFVGPLLSKTSNSALGTAVAAALANENGLGAGTATAATAAQGGKDLANALATYASSQGNAATVAALTGPGANSTSALAIALV